MNIIFSHANGYAAPVYGVLFAALKSRGIQVAAPDKLGHDPRFPVDDNWASLTQELLAFARQEVARQNAPAWLVGHSLGGYLSLMARVSKHTGMVDSFSPSKVSQRRRQTWPSVEAVLAHFKSKKVFAQWHPQVLEDYATHGTQAATENDQIQRVLSFDRSVETAVYNTLPHQMPSFLKAHPVSCPVAFIGGTRSVEVRRVGMALTQRITKGRIMMLDGSHLFPMEIPQVTVAAIETALLNLKSLG